METKEFLQAVLPSQGVYFAATQIPGGKGFNHFACDSVAELAIRCLDYDEQEATTYFATSSYKNKEVINRKGKAAYRTQENVQLVRSFWLDLDVGEGKDYASQADAMVALGKFLKDTGLPVPIIVNSGNGVHVYWPLKQDIAPGQWKVTAENLKALTTGLGLNADPARTSDTASVLRAPGTHNRKGGQAKIVSVINEGQGPIDWLDFNSTISKMMKQHKLVVKRETATQLGEKLNEGALVKSAFPPANANLVADRCNQVREFRDKAGNIKEPHWYAAIGLVAKTTNGEAVVHEWSKGFSSYDKDETDQKLEQIKDFGPTTCSKFDAVNPGGCEGCPFAGRVTTPIALGVEVQEAAPPTVKVVTEEGEVEVRLPNPPPPFSRGSGETAGLYYEIDGVPVRFYENDLFPVALEYDEADGFETARIRHHLPRDGWKEFMLRTSNVVTPSDFNKALFDASVKCNTEGKQKDTMRTYMTSYLKKLQEETRIKTHHLQCGWKENNTEFLLGNRMFQANGKHYHSGLSKRVHDLSEAFEPAGDFDTWYELSEQLTKPGYEAHTFALALGFGAPLLSLMGFHGMLVNMVGDSGVGKSTTAWWMFSIYGNFEKGISTDNSTTLARLSKMSTFGHLPMYIDELTKKEPKDVSDLAYSIANGAGRERLNSDASVQEVQRWNTFVLSSSNNHIHDKLRLDAGNPEAQILRVFEYEFNKAPGYDKFIEERLVPTLRNNYGQAGERYIGNLVQADKEVIRNLVKGYKDRLSEAFNGQGKERFWFFGAAVALAGLAMAHHWGIVKVGPESIFDWIGEQIKIMRREAEAMYKDELELLSEYMNDTQQERLIVNTDTGLHQSAIVVKAPATHAKLSQRYELDTKQLYISYGSLQKWATARGENMNAIGKRLVERGVMKYNKVIKRSLGAFTEFGGGRVHCWHINMNHPDMKEVLDVAEQAVVE